MKIALYKNIEYGFVSVHEAKDEKYVLEDYTRITEYIDVEFIPIKNDVIVKAQVELLDKKAEEITAKYHVASNDIDKRKADLLALTYQEK